jgi:hypothetical protein
MMGGYKNFTDMFDGGGPGMAGPQFEGGFLSNFLNEIGIKPYGSAGRAGQGVQASPVPPPRPNAPPMPSSISDTDPRTWQARLEAIGGQPNTGDPVRDGTYAALNSPQGLMDAAARGPVPQSSAEAARRAALLSLMPNTFGGV